LDWRVSKVLCFSRSPPKSTRHPDYQQQRHPQHRRFRVLRYGVLQARRGEPTAENAANTWAWPEVKHMHLEK
jgi:hypothetical protein